MRDGDQARTLAALVRAAGLPVIRSGMCDAGGAPLAARVDVGKLADAERALAAVQAAGRTTARLWCGVSAWAILEYA